MTELGNKASLIGIELSKSNSTPSMHSGRNPAELKEEYDKLQAEYTLLHDEFINAKDSPKTASSFMLWSGVAFILAGGLVALSGRNG